ncbi:unnamed protein product [Bursaphelenchus xylophilus]|uniref:(pine wood nematode) hypothetical protein n=1 Tax=Bursaphelenchus xylophilus TaxID=6326 RepID=A0A7I8X9X5_BURXY|nr:unnamed protein product [Bursaphelenchus xylophilus]CAG9132253.1 unnamed protein product [Bursaphelenchus xylophilus]
MWSWLVDFIVSVLHMPQLLLPVIGLCVGGVFADSHSMAIMLILMISFVIAMCGTGLSVITAFSYRLVVVKTGKDMTKYPSILIAILLAHILVPAAICAPMIYAVLYDVHAVEEEIRRQHLGVYMYMEGRTCSFLSINLTPYSVRD